MFRSILAFFLLLVVTMSTAAQGTPPDQINRALEALSEEVGQTVALADLDNYTWSEEVYSDASMGCPTVGEFYAQQVTPAYRFVLTYEGTTYDFRVSQLNDVVRQCPYDESAGSAGEDTGAEETPRVVDPSDLVVTLVEFGMEVITPDNLDQVRPLSELEGPFGDTMTWSPDGTWLAVTRQDGRAVLLYDMEAGERIPSLVEIGETITALEFHPVLPLLAIGDSAGIVSVWSADEEAVIDTIAVSDQAVHSLHFNASGQSLAVLSADARVTFWGIAGE